MLERDLVDMFTIRLDEKTEKRLERFAQKAGQTKTAYAREIILEHIEDREDVLLAVKRLKSPRKIYSAGEVVRELGL